MARRLERRSTAVLEQAAAERRERDFGLQSPAQRRIVEVPLDRILPNPEQPRHLFDAESMEALKASIERNGLLQPIGVKPMDDGRFRLVYGERRLRAVRELGQATILGLTLDGNDDEIAVIENLQRVDLDPFEEAEAFERLRLRHGYPYSVIARITGRSKSDVGRIFTLLKLPEAVKDAYRAMDEKPLRTRMYAIAAAEPADQLRLWEALIAPPASGPPVLDADGTGEEDAADLPHPLMERRMDPASAILSALPKRVALKIHHANEVLTALRNEPRPLWQSDLQMLIEMRDTLDAIIAAARKKR